MLRSKNNRLFIKIFSRLLAVVLVLTILFGAVLFESMSRARNSARAALNLEFNNGAEGVLRVFSQIKYAMSELSTEAVADGSFKTGAYMGGNGLRSEMREIFVDRRQNEFSGYLSTLFIVDASKTGDTYEITGTYSSDKFYNQYFFNEVYTEDFWVSKISDGETFEIFPAKMYLTARDAKRVDMMLLPVTYKPKGDSGCMVVMLLDIKLLAENYGVTGIKSENGEVLYTSDKTVGVGGEMLAHSKKISEKNIFTFSDEKNGDVEVFGIVSESDIREEMSNVNIVSLIIFALFVILAIVFAVIFSKRVVKLFVNATETLIANTVVKSQFENGINTVKDVFDAVKIVTSQENSLVSSEKGNESVLDSMVLQAHMRDVYAGIEDIEAQINTSKAFFMVYFKVSYMKKFTEFMKQDTGKATFLLKQLIEMYLEAWGISTVTFQTKKDGIVSVFGAENGISPRNVVDDILEKLSNESEYAYFTVSVSDVHDGTDSIKQVYENLVDTVKYGKPVMETQVLSENQGREGVSHFYFSVEEMGKFSAILQNGTEEEAVRKVDEILDYNLRKDVNRFEMYLLCTEIVNCAIKLINRVFYTVGQNVDISLVYRKLERATAPEDYRDVCVDFLHETMEYMKENKREDDYIISYIFDYVENHYSEDIYLNLFAEKLKLTGAYISSYFKEKTNVNLTDYINHYRIKKAVILSENPQNKNKDIAEMVGLPNINTFIRLFKKYTGYTPGEYRKKHFGDEGKG